MQHSPIVSHDITELIQHFIRHFILGGKGLVQIHARHGRSHHIKDVRLDLVAWIRQAVVRIVRRVGNDTVLRGDTDLHKDVVLRFRLANHVQLLDAEGHAADDAFQRILDAVEAGVQQSFELAEVFYL